MAVEELISFMRNDISQKFPENMDKIFVFSNLLKLKFSRADHIDLIRSLMTSFPKSAFIFPAYTYNSRTLQPYSSNQKPNPQCGSLSRVVFEEFKESLVRTFDEDYSYFVLNHQNLSEDFLGDITKWRESSFGESSHHDAMFSESGIFLIVADEMDSGFTPSMQCEAVANVPYRRMELFPSMARKGNIKRYFARQENEFDSFGKACRWRSLNLMRQENILATCNHNLGPKTFAFPVKQYIDAVTQELVVNPNLFLEESK